VRSTHGLSVGSLELAGRSFLIDLLHVFLIGASLLTGLDSSGSEEVSTDETEVGEDLSGFRVGEEKGQESSKVDRGVLGIVLDVASVGRESILGLSASLGVGLQIGKGKERRSAVDQLWQLKPHSFQRAIRG
jgi:hypothetical protein